MPDRSSRIPPASVGTSQFVDGVGGGNVLPDHGVHARHRAPALPGNILDPGAVQAGKGAHQSVEAHMHRDRGLTGRMFVDECLAHRHLGKRVLLGRNVHPQEVGDSHIATATLIWGHMQNGAAGTEQIALGTFYDYHITSINYSKIYFPGNRLIPGGNPGEIATFIGNGRMAWRPPLGAKWELLHRGERVTRTTDTSLSSDQTLIAGRRFLDYSVLVWTTYLSSGRLGYRTIEIPRALFDTTSETNPYEYGLFSLYKVSETQFRVNGISTENRHLGYASLYGQRGQR